MSLIGARHAADDRGFGGSPEGFTEGRQFLYAATSGQLPCALSCMPLLWAQQKGHTLNGVALIVTQMVTHYDPDMSVTALIHDEAMG